MPFLNQLSNTKLHTQRNFKTSESTNATHAKLNGNYKSTHSIRTLKGA
ncbi:MAG: hypothetical protein CM15mP65_26610 [Crocinitomicaceae bacterium]|nr:MAG: hypothetical protein CM15mP65_26610 [Crocinitomicaceae bacterium]